MPELFFQLFLFAYIGHGDDHAANRSGGIPQGRGPDLDIDQRAIFLMPAPFQAGVGFSTSGLLDFFTELRQMVRGDEEWRLTDDLVRAPTKHPLGRQVPTLYVTLK